MKNAVQEVYELVREKALEYAPDQEYLEEDEDVAAEVEALENESFRGVESLSMAVSFLEAWFPDFVDEEEKEELSQLLENANKLI